MIYVFNTKKFSVKGGVIVADRSQRNLLTEYARKTGETLNCFTV